MVVIADNGTSNLADLTPVRRWTIRLAKLCCSRLSFALASLARIAQRLCAVPFPVAPGEEFAVLLVLAASAQALAQLAGAHRGWCDYAASLARLAFF